VKTDPFRQIHNCPRCRIVAIAITGSDLLGHKSTHQGISAAKVARMNIDGSARNPQERYRVVRRKMLGTSVVFLILCIAAVLSEHTAVMTVVIGVVAVSEIIVIRKVLRLERRAALEQEPNGRVRGRGGAA
jgi:hypothetical protein